MNEQDKANVNCTEAENNETEIAATEAAATTIDDNAVFDEEAITKTLIRIRAGQVITGTVIQITDGEVSVNIGYKSDGYIPRSEFSNDPEVDPAQVCKVGDEIEVEVLKVNDGEGMYCSPVRTSRVRRHGKNSLLMPSPKVRSSKASAKKRLRAV